MILLLLALPALSSVAGLQVKQDATWYHADAYSPAYLIRRQPWQAIAVDSKGRVYVAHPFATAAGNRSTSSRRLQIFDPSGEPLAELKQKDGPAAFGLAVDEAGGRILTAANFQHVLAYGWKGPGAPIEPLKEPLGKNDGGRCVGVSLGKGGTLFTADLAENRVFRHYPAGGRSSFGSGPGAGRQGFNDLRRVFESPLDGSLLALDNDGVRRFSPIGAFVERVGSPAKDGGGVLAMGPDGRMLVGGQGDLELFDAQGKRLRALPIPAASICDAALGADGRIFTIPRGEEFCFDAYDPEGKLLYRRGADFDRITVTLASRELKAGAQAAADVRFGNALQAGLLSAADRKSAEKRALPSKASVFLKSGADWKPLAWAEGKLDIPGAEGAQVLRFTTAPGPEDPGLRVDVRVTIVR